MTLPGVATVLRYHERMLATLRHQRQCYGVVTSNPGPFLGMTELDYEESLSELREELDKEVVLVIG